ncbi:HAMP domain-containing sensor histidine kinase [Promicromonospora sp. NFX87]|uniref:HAMP domain-containing sensor histidine kinase n=1 Tax=Promicromonospora sp. NFX87 TaxID=3402691 RepID=UPI003AFB0908
MSLSLRARVLTLGIGAAVAVLLLLTVPTVLVVSQDAREDADRGAEITAQSVADAAENSSGTATDLEDLVTLTNERDDAEVTVLLPDGTALGAERPECVATAVEAAPDGDGDGSGPGRGPEDSPPDQIDGGRLVTLAARSSAGDVTVCAFVPSSTARLQTLTRLGAIGGAGLAVLVVVAVAAVLVARRIARPLATVADTADRLGRGDLGARVPDEGPPEVRRVGAALNGLATRIEELLRTERETVADLSHRLRTPLTAVRLDVESLPDSPARTELEDHVAQLQRTLTAVIRAARRPQREGATPRCDAAAVARERFGFWAPLLEDQGRVTTFAAPPGTWPVRCAAEDLAAALDALLENVAAHTPDGSPVAAEVTRGDGGTVRVDIKDQGPGLPAFALERGRSDRGSTGLGLDIARACAEATGGRLEVRSEPPWSTVRLELGTT